MYDVVPARSLGPGTGLVEFNPGMGEYVRTDSYMLSPAFDAGIVGMSGCGCKSCNQGMGQTGVFGTSLFESTDPALWGWGEWACIVGGAYVALSVFDTTRRGASAATRKSRAVRKALRS